MACFNPPALASIGMQALIDIAAGWWGCGVMLRGRPCGVPIASMLRRDEDKIDEQLNSQRGVKDKAPDIRAEGQKALLGGPGPLCQLDAGTGGPRTRVGSAGEEQYGRVRAARIMQASRRWGVAGRFVNFVYQPVMNAVTAISSQGSGSAVTFVHRGVMRPTGPYVSLSKAAYPFGVNNPHGGAFPLSPEGSTR